MRRSLAVLAWIALLGCASPAREDRTGTAAFDQMMQEFSASLSAGDADRWLGPWAIQNAETHNAGDYLTILRKQGDGSWKIYRDCFNSNVPPGKSS